MLAQNLVACLHSCQQCSQGQPSRFCASYPSLPGASHFMEGKVNCFPLPEFDERPGQESLETGAAHSTSQHCQALHGHAAVKQRPLLSGAACTWATRAALRCAAGHAQRGSAAGDRRAAAVDALAGARRAAVEPPPGGPLAEQLAAAGAGSQPAAGGGGRGRCRRGGSPGNVATAGNMPAALHASYGSTPFSRPAGRTIGVSQLRRPAQAAAKTTTSLKLLHMQYTAEVRSFPLLLPCFHLAQNNKIR